MSAMKATNAALVRMVGIFKKSQHLPSLCAHLLRFTELLSSFLSAKALHEEISYELSLPLQKNSVY